MKEKLLKGLKWAAYPAFYLGCLLVFGVLTFPVDRMKDRLLAEIASRSKGKNAPVVTVDKMDSYWLTGAEVEGLRVRLPAEEPKGFGGMGGFGMPAPPPAKDSVILVKEAHARARILPLLIGRVQLDFWASVFGGEVEGTAPAGAASGDVELRVTDAQLSDVEPLQNLLGVPIGGRVNGELSLSPTDGKFNKASGKVELSVKGLVVSDGKTKIQGLLAIPAAKVEELSIVGEAEKGVLKITKLSANGPDLELDGEGKITLREPWAESSADLYIKFRFTDHYRGKDATTRSLLGEPGSAGTPLIEMQVAKLKKAKRPDGFYGFHVHGRLKKLDFTPSATEVTSSSRKGKGGDSPGLTPGSTKKVGGVALPLGASSAIQNRDRDGEKDEKEDAPEEKTEERRPMVPPGLRNLVPNIPAPPPRPPANEEPVVNAPPGGGDSPSGGSHAGGAPAGDPHPGEAQPGEPPAVEERPQEPPAEDPTR